MNKQGRRGQAKQKIKLNAVVPINIGQSQFHRLAARRLQYINKKIMMRIAIEGKSTSGDQQQIIMCELHVM